MKLNSDEFTFPKDIQNQTEKLIELAFVRFKSTAKTSSFPIIYLAGGPGGSGINLAKGARFPLFMAMREFGDVIALDQRGAGLSKPNLKLKEILIKDFQEMHKAGVRLMPGTDVAVLLIYPGYSLHDELQLLVKYVGLTPMEAIISATRYPAEFFGIQNTLGTIEKGKIADLVLLDANPLDDIGSTKQIAAAVLNGRYFSKQAREKMLADVEAVANKK